MTTTEQYNQMIAALEAAREGKAVDCRPKGSTTKWVNDVLPSWNFDCWEYRPAPQPKPPRWVAWTFKTCPRGDTWIRRKGMNIDSKIGSVFEAGLAFHDGCDKVTNSTYQSIFNNYTLLDGSPCGTLVKEEGE